MTLMLATKLNWWMTNHHTGQGEFSPYIKKVIAAICPNWVEVEVKRWLHAIIGHWCSTHRILRLLGISMSAVSTPLVVAGILPPPTLAEDMVLRTSSMPAGTARHAVSAAIIKRHGGHKIFMFSSRTQDMVNLVREFDALMANGKANVTKVLANNPDALANDPRPLFLKRI